MNVEGAGATERLSEEQRAKARKLEWDYRVARAQIRDGDVLCFRGRAALSKFIMRLSHGQFSHGAIAFHWGGRLLVTQAEYGPGVQAVPFTRLVRKYDGDVEWFALRDDLRERHVGPLLRSATHCLGDPYSAFELFRIGLAYGVGTKLPRPQRHQFVCSQYVAHVFSQAGIDLAPNKPDVGTTPDDLARSDHLVPRGIIRVGRGGKVG